MTLTLTDALELAHRIAYYDFSRDEALFDDITDELERALDAARHGWPLGPTPKIDHFLGMYRRPATWGRCVDCGFGTNVGGEYFMVKDEVWAAAWPVLKPHHAFPGQQVLCIGCLEGRIGRKLNRDDFTDVEVNTDADRHRSERLRNRLRRWTKSP